MKFYNQNNYKVTEKDAMIKEGDELDKLDTYIRKLSTRQGQGGINRGNDTGNETNEATDTERSKIQKKLLIIRELKKRTSLLSTFATLFNAMGNFKACESCYVHYLKMIQVNYSKDSLEASNCFFMMGSFYLSSSSPSCPHLKKAVSCFMVSLKIRSKVLPDTHTSISDCYYNIGIILFLARNSVENTAEFLDSVDSTSRKINGIRDRGTLVERSLNWIWNALSIRV